MGAGDIQTLMKNQLAVLGKAMGLYRNPWWAWLVAAGITVVTYFAMLLCLLLLVRWLKVAQVRFHTVVDDYLVDVLKKRINRFLLAAFAIYFGSLSLKLVPGIRTFINDVALTAAFLMAAVWANEAIKFWFSRQIERRYKEDPDSASTIVAMSFLARLGLWSLLLVVILGNLGVNVTTLIAGLGVGGVALALASQTILADFFSSFAITLDRPFRVGDFIIVGDFKGTVERIGLKTTSVRSLDGEQIVFGNNDLLKSRIRNYKRMEKRRVLFNIGVTYQTPPDKLETIKRIIREAIESQDQTAVDRIHFQRYGDFALVFEVVYFVLDRDYTLYMDIQDAINTIVYRRFAEEGIQFAYPTRTIFQIPVAQPETRPADLPGGDSTKT
ncbi:MAG: mechanosensitive ion channel family protein [Proteobacteria bacterium]|nr:mechanosensitive ion channel family protein [Pseudomonadota bacterium]